MKRALILSITIAALAAASPAVATPVTLTFTSAGIPWIPGDDYGSVNIGVGSNTKGTNLAVSQLVVLGDGAYDGTYAVTGAVHGYGALNFRTDLGDQYIYIDGAVAGLSVLPTRLLEGTGGGSGFTNLVITQNCTGLGFPDFYACFHISFDTPDTKAETLLAALGLSGATPWTLATTDIAVGTGNNFPEYSVNAVNTYQSPTTKGVDVTAVPEPATLVLFGTGLMGLAALRRRKARV